MMELVRQDIDTPWLALTGLEPKLWLADSSKPYSEHCQIEAGNDLEAVRCWLQPYKTSPNSFKAYYKEAKRLLLWCTYERGLSLGQLKVQDFEQYFEFLRNPPNYWCASHNGAKPAKKKLWYPLKGPLNESACCTAARIINSFINYLVEADYLRTNPMKLLNTSFTFNLEAEVQKYKVWERMLEADEWIAVQKALQEMPAENAKEINHKMRTQFLFALLYLLGLRIHEVAISSWNAFRKRNGNWWFFIKGKGGRLGHIPVNEQLLSYIKAYRLHLGKTPLPDLDETEGLLISKKTRRPLKVRQLYGLVKAIGRLAANTFAEQPLKKQKLEQLSPHWLRHLSASHQDKAGIPATVIQANHRHRSSQTTQIYLHAEDALRATEIQKLKMAIEPAIISKIDNSSSVELKVIIKGSPVCGRVNLKRLLEAIETGILKLISWEREEADVEILLNRYEQLNKYGSALAFSYYISPIEEDKLNEIKLGIVREASIRLFECEFDYKAIA